MPDESRGPGGAGRRPDWIPVAEPGSPRADAGRPLAETGRPLAEPGRGGDATDGVAAGPAGDPAGHKPGFRPGDVLLVLLVAALLLLIVPQFQVAFQVIFQDAEVDTGDLTAAALWLNAAILLVVFGALPFLWVLSTRNEPWRGTILYLRLHDPGRGALWGLALGIGLVVALVLLGLLLDAIGQAPDNPALDPLASILTLPLALFLSLSAAVGEEILFRGVVQRWIGVWGQAAVFGALHAYQGVYGIALTFLLALVFGFMVKRGGSLWIAIVAHFVFDVIQLVALLYMPESA